MAATPAMFLLALAPKKLIKPLKNTGIAFMGPRGVLDQLAL
jgi:hypothetical protein